MKHTILVAIVILGVAGTARAGGQPGSIGVGVEEQISGVGGISVNYDAGRFHVGGALSFEDPAGRDNSIFEIGGRFFYHLASTAMSDFSIGGGLGIRHNDNGGNGTTALYLEPGFQIRAFIASNVALSFTAAISVGAADASDVVINGDLTGTAGVHYYF
jgi:hypothetical protein